jgi:hypothetical protein
MSHFTKCELKMTNLQAIKNALDDLEWDYEEATAGQSVTVRGWRGQTLEAAMSINMGKYDIGVVKNENGTFDLVSDWWGIETTKGLTETELKNTISQKYQYHNVKMACEDKGYSVEEEVNEEDGSIQLVVRRWVHD